MVQDGVHLTADIRHHRAEAVHLSAGVRHLNATSNDLGGAADRLLPQNYFGAPVTDRPPAASS
jgi:hypothetical protein